MNKKQHCGTPADVSTQTQTYTRTKKKKMAEKERKGRKGRKIRKTKKMKKQKKQKKQEAEGRKKEIEIERKEEDILHQQWGQAWALAPRHRIHRSGRMQALQCWTQGHARGRQAARSAAPPQHSLQLRSPRNGKKAIHQFYDAWVRHTSPRVHCEILLAQITGLRTLTPARERRGITARVNPGTSL